MNCRYLRSPALLRTARRLFATRKNCRSEEHTSELQSQSNLVCRLLLEKKKKPPSCRSHALHRCTSSTSQSSNLGSASSPLRSAPLYYPTTLYNRLQSVGITQQILRVA